MTTFRGTNGDDNLTGTSGNDDFILYQGGNDTADAGAGNDVFHMGAALGAGDKLDGGDGKDSVMLNGDYSAGLVFNADTITNIEVIGLSGGHSYNLTLNDGNLAAGERLLVNAGNLGAGDTLTFDGSAETDGGYYIIADAGNDTLTGGAMNDVFDLGKGGNDTAHGGGGYDTFLLGAALTTADMIEGGAGDDTLELDGKYSGGKAYTFGAGQLTSIETLKLDAQQNYTLTMNDGNVGSGDTLTVDFSELRSGNQVRFDGRAEQDGSFHFIAGLANYISISGGNGNDIFDLTGAGGGAMVSLGGSGGDNTFLFGANYNDLQIGIIEGGGGDDTLEFNGDYSSLSVYNQVDSVETIRFDGGHTYKNVLVHINDPPAGEPAYVTLDASQVSTLFQVKLEWSAFIVEIGSGGMDATAPGGDDIFIVTSRLSLAASSLDAGSGTDTLELNYSSSSVTTFGPSTISNFEIIKLDSGHPYDLKMNDANVGAGATLTVDGSALTGLNTLSFNGAAERDGFFAVTGGSGNDIFIMGAALKGGDRLDGGAGNDFLVLNGDYSAGLVFNSDTIVNIEVMGLVAGHSYNLTLDDGNAAAGSRLLVKAGTLGAGNTLTFDGSTETDGRFVIYGGAGNDTIIGGARSDIISSGEGADTLTGGGGADTFDYGSALLSNTASLDRITDFTAGTDKFNLYFIPVSFQGEFNSGAATGTLDGDLAAAFTANAGGTHSGFVFDFTGADFAGQSFLVVDSNGNAQYDAGTDLVIEITGHAGTVTSGDFV